MQKKLHLLESFKAEGSDGKTYKVCGYEHMVRDESAVDGLDHWEATGVSEYRLDDGRHLEPRADGAMLIAGTEVLVRAVASASP